MASQELNTRRGSAEAGPRDSTDEIDIDAVMRRFLARGRDDAAETRTVTEMSQSKQPRRDVDMACELLDQASRAFILLLNRCERLEQDLGEAHERAKIQAAEHEATMQQWRKLAAGMQAQIAAHDQKIAGLTSRADAAESRAASVETRNAALERAATQAATHAATSEQLSTKLHDKVVTAFGIGSRVHPVLQAMITQIAAE